MPQQMLDLLTNLLQLHTHQNTSAQIPIWSLKFRVNDTRLTKFALCPVQLYFIQVLP